MVFEIFSLPAAPGAETEREIRIVDGKVQPVSCGGRLAAIDMMSRMPVPGIGRGIFMVAPGAVMIPGSIVVLGALMVPGSKVPGTPVGRRPVEVPAMMLLIPLVVALAAPVLIPASFAVGPGRTRQ